MRRKLQLAADELQKWFIKCKVILAHQRVAPEALHIARKRDRTVGNISPAGEEIEWANEVRHLGVVLEVKWTWGQYVTTMINQTRIAKPKKSDEHEEQTFAYQEYRPAGDWVTGKTSDHRKICCGWP